MNKVSTLLKSKGADVFSVAPDATVYEAIRAMAEKEVGALLVMTGDKLVGVISERDYAREIILKGRSSKTTLVEEIMTKNIITLLAGDNLDRGLKLMTEKRVRHLPVMKDNVILGILSLGDLVKEMIDYQKNIIEQLETFIKN